MILTRFFNGKMSKTLLAIRSQVRSFLDEPSNKQADWTNVELNQLINVYYHKVYSAGLKVFENYAPLSTTFLNTVATQQEYDLTTITPGILMLRRVEINYDVSNTDSVPTRALPIEMDAVRRDLGNTNLGSTLTRGANYYLSGNLLGFLPIPDKNGTDAIKLWYNPVKVDMTQDGDTIDLPYADRDWMLVAYGATSEALRFGQQESLEADKFDKKFKDGVAEMQAELEDRVSEESKAIIDTSGMSLDFQNNYGGF